MPSRMVPTKGAPSALMKHPALGKAVAAMAAYEGAKQAWASLSMMYREHRLYTIAIDESDYAYGDVHEWLLTLVPTDKQRSLTASTVSRRDIMFAEDDGADKPPAGVTLKFNDRRPRKLKIDGHTVTAQVKRSDDVTDSSAKKPLDQIEFASHTQAGQLAVVRQLEEIQRQKGVRNPVLRVVNQWGNWQRRSDLPLRSLESVVLPEAQKAEIVGDLSKFLDDEQEYVRLDLPWHRGYLLHGPPGTGKTSLVKALANEFKQDLWYVPLGDLKEEASLLNLLAEVSPRSIVLLEDADTIRLTHDRAKDGGGDSAEGGGRLSLSSLLNALDGVATPHGLVFFITTNHFEKLDPALVRAGRMDRIEELAYPGPAEASALFRRFFGEELGEAGDLFGLSQADLSEVFKRHMGDPAGARAALADLVGEHATRA